MNRPLAKYRNSNLPKSFRIMLHVSKDARSVSRINSVLREIGGTYCFQGDNRWLAELSAARIITPLVCVPSVMIGIWGVHHLPPASPDAGRRGRNVGPATLFQED